MLGRLGSRHVFKVHSNKEREREREGPGERERVRICVCEIERERSGKCVCVCVFGETERLESEKCQRERQETKKSTLHPFGLPLHQTFYLL